MPQRHIEQLNHNTAFHSSVCTSFPDQFYDWKITVLFYAALHCIKAHFRNKNIDIGNTHAEIERNINPRITHAPHKVNKGCWHNYKSLYRYSQTARYDGIADSAIYEESLKADHAYCVEHLEAVKLYVKSQGLTL